jgi:hypothetical protein
MKKRTQEEFDADLHQRVTLATRGLVKLAELVEQRPDLVSERRAKNILTHLNNVMVGIVTRINLARQTAAGRDVPFSLDAEIEPVAIAPGETVLPMVSTPAPGPRLADPNYKRKQAQRAAAKAAEADGAGFIEETN